jgi:hypothetical protein
MSHTLPTALIHHPFFCTEEDANGDFRVILTFPQHLTAFQCQQWLADYSGPPEPEDGQPREYHVGLNPQHTAEPTRYARTSYVLSPYREKPRRSISVSVGVGRTSFKTLGISFLSI